MTANLMSLVPLVFLAGFVAYAVLKSRVRSPFLVALAIVWVAGSLVVVALMLFPAPVEERGPLPPNRLHVVETAMAQATATPGPWWNFWDR